MTYFAENIQQGWRTWDWVEETAVATAIVGSAAALTFGTGGLYLAVPLVNLVAKQIFSTLSLEGSDPMSRSEFTACETEAAIFQTVVTGAALLALAPLTTSASLGLTFAAAALMLAETAFALANTRDDYFCNEDCSWYSSKEEAEKAQSSAAGPQKKPQKTESGYQYNGSAFADLGAAWQQFSKNNAGVHTDGTSYFWNGLRFSKPEEAEKACGVDPKEPPKTMNGKVIYNATLYATFEEAWIAFSAVNTEYPPHGKIFRGQTFSSLSDACKEFSIYNPTKIIHDGTNFWRAGVLLLFHAPTASNKPQKDASGCTTYSEVIFCKAADAYTAYSKHTVGIVHECEGRFFANGKEYASLEEAEKYRTFYKQGLQWFAKGKGFLTKDAAGKHLSAGDTQEMYHRGKTWYFNGKAFKKEHEAYKEWSKFNAKEKPFEHGGRKYLNGELIG